MARYTPQFQSRRGFTLVEMLVSTALILFILLIITTVFTTGIGALRSLRATGHLQDEARHAVSALRRDLAAPHFGRETDGLRGPALSQQRLDHYDWTPPKEGFFRIYQGSPSIIEGYDNETPPNASYVAVNHALHFTVRVEPNTAQGTGRDQFFSTNSILPAFVRPPLPPTTPLMLPNYPPRTNPDPYAPYRMRVTQSSSHINDPNWDVTGNQTLYSPWAEVAYFLRESGQSAGTSKLYTLFRRRRVLLDVQQAYLRPVGTNPPVPATDNNLMFSGTAADAARMTDASIFTTPAVTNTIFFNTPSNINVPFRRYGADPTSPAGLFPNPDTLAMPIPAPGGYHSIYDDFGPNNASSGDDILLENVLSFEIKVSWDAPTDPRVNAYGPAVNQLWKVSPPYPFEGRSKLAQSIGVPAMNAMFSVPRNPDRNSDFPFDDLPMSPVNQFNAATSFGNWSFVPTPSSPPTNPRVFDTWRGEDYGGVLYSNWNRYYENGGSTPAAVPPSSVTIPLRIRVKAVQIRLRIWDDKTKQTRQVTIVQDL